MIYKVECDSFSFAFVFAFVFAEMQRACQRRSDENCQMTKIVSLLISGSDKNCQLGY